MIGSEIRGSHGHGICSKLHRLVDNVRVVSLMDGRRKVVVCR
jgi:hypothetical protein